MAEQRIKDIRSEPKDQNLRKIIQEEIEKSRRVLYDTDILNKTIKQRHIKDYVVFRGNVADLPSDGTREIQVFFAEDESKLYVWNTVNEAWESVTLA